MNRYKQDTNSMDMATMESSQGIEDHVAVDKAHQLSKIVNSSVLESFVKLGSNAERNRVTAGVALLRHLHQKQIEREDESVSLEVNYALKRLIRGVSTSCASKRAGFFSVLVEVLNLFPQISVQDVMNIVDLELQPHRNDAKKELTEAYGGQVFVIGALIRSNKFLSASPEEQGYMVERMVSAGRKKTIFLSCINCFLVQLMEKLDDVKFREVVWRYIEVELTKSWEEHTADSLYLLLECRGHFPKVVKKQFIVKTLGTNEILNEESIHYFSKLLMDSPLIILNNHPLYETLCHKVSTSPLLIPFWELLVREMEKRPSQHREQALINTFVKFLPVVNKKQIPQLLCDGFMEFIIKTLQSKKNKGDLANDASELFTKMTSVLATAETDEDCKISFIKLLLQHLGRLSFDPLGGTKIVVELCSSMSIEGVDAVGKLLTNIISSSEPKVKYLEGETRPWSKQERIYAIQLFSKLLNLPIAQENLQWKMKQLKFLISQGFIVNSVHQIRGEVIDKLFKVLDPKLSTVDQLITLLSSLVNHINDLMNVKQKSSKFIRPLSESSIAAWKKMFAVVNELVNEHGNETGPKKSGRKLFMVLFLYMGLLLLQDAALAEEALQELHSCYERMKNSSPKSKMKRNVKTDSGEKEPHWVDVIVDLFLLLLSRNSNRFRHVVGSIFPHLCPYITATSLYQLLEVLDPNAKKPLSSAAPAAADDDDDASSDETDDEDGNSNNKESGSKVDDSETDDDDDDDNDDNDDFSDNEPVNAELKMAVENALRKTMSNSKDSDEESLDMDQMSEEDRAKLDAALSEAFKVLKHTQAKKKNQKQSKDDEAVMHFRIRVLDLLEVYLSNKPELTLVLDIMLPLFDLLEFCIKNNHQKPMENRVRGCLKKLTHVKQFSSMAAVDEALLGEMLRKLLYKGERVAAVYQNMGNPLSQCSTFLARTFLRLQQEGMVKESTSSPIIDVYTEALDSFFMNRASLIPIDVFRLALVHHWKGAWILANNILQFAFSAECRPFRRSQAVKLLDTFFSNGRLTQDASPEHLKELQKMEKKLCDKSAEMLQNVMSGKQNGVFIVKEKNIEELLRLLLTVNKLDCRGTTPSGIQWEALMETVLQYWKSKSLGTDTKVALKKLTKALNMNLTKKTGNEHRGSVGNKSKEQKLNQQVAEGNSALHKEGGHSDEDEEEEVVSEDTGDKGYESGNNGVEELNKKRKRAKSQNEKGKALLRKQAKERRLATLSQGFLGFSFAQVNFPTSQKLSNENGSMVLEGRKRNNEKGKNKYEKKQKKSVNDVPANDISESRSERKFNLEVKWSAKEIVKKKQKIPST